MSTVGEGGSWSDPWMMTWLCWYKRVLAHFLNLYFQKERIVRKNKNRPIHKPFSFKLLSSPMAFFSQVGVLKYSDEAPMPELRDQWLSTRTLSDSFFDKELVGSALAVKRLDDDDNAPLSKFLHQIVFPDHVQRDRFTINRRSILRMRIQRKIHSTKNYKE